MWVHCRAQRIPLISFGAYRDCLGGVVSLLSGPFREDISTRTRARPGNRCGGADGYDGVVSAGSWAPASLSLFGEAASFRKSIGISAAAGPHDVPPAVSPTVSQAGAGRTPACISYRGPDLMVVAQRSARPWTTRVVCEATVHSRSPRRSSSPHCSRMPNRSGLSTNDVAEHLV